MVAVARGWIGLALAAGIAVLLVGACVPPSVPPSPTASPTPTATSTPTVTPTPSPTATPTSTDPPAPPATPTPSPTDIPPSPTPSAPGPTPTPTPAPTSNLTWVTPRNWETPLSLTNERGRRGGSSASLDEPIYVSWAVQNTGPLAVTQPFSTHLYLNGVFLNSWRGDRVNAGSFVFFDDWEGITNSIRLVPGEHTLTMWIDPYDELHETVEDDNIVELTVVIEGEPPERTATRLPDLVLEPREGWEEALVLNAWAAERTNGPLSVDAPTYLNFAAKNVGLSSVLDGVSADLYVDDIYVEAWRWGYVLTDDTFYLGAWDRLPSTMRLTPGEHTVRVVLDAGDFIHESDETNNTIERTFTWGTGAVGEPPAVQPTPTPTPPAPLSRPNLLPYWRFGASGPLTVSNQPGTRTNDPPIAGTTVYLDVSVINQSLFPTGAFSIAVRLNDTVVRTLNVASLSASGVREFIDQPLFLDVTPGGHTLSMTVDSGNTIAEHDESDNVYELTFTVYGSAPAPTPTATFSDDQIASLLGRLVPALDDRRPVLGAGGSGLDVYAVEVADLGYYLMTGVSIRDEPMRVLLLDDAGYRQWIDDTYVDDFATSPTSQHADLLARREHLKEVNPAFKTRDRGVVTVVVNAEHSFADVLASLAHELGHAKQDFDRPEQTVGSATYELNGLQEAQAQQFERAFWLTLESRLDQRILAYPEHEAFAAYVDSLFSGRFADYAREEHALGYVVQWLAVLADPELVALKVELSTDGELSAAGSLRMFNRLIAIPPADASAYVNGLLEALPTWRPTILETALARRVPGLAPDLEGPPDLRGVALASP